MEIVFKTLIMTLAIIGFYFTVTVSASFIVEAWAKGKK